MKQSVITILILGLTLSLSGQKSRVMAVMQMIDAEKYDDAKEAIDLAVGNGKTSSWHRTYYAKGLLCQTAYEAGVKANDSKKTNLYPDQLFVAYDSYEKALELDIRERLHTAIRQKYYLLANDFRTLGEELYRKGVYKESLRAFEQALLIGKRDFISAKTDTNLVYNTAMAAYESENWEKATEYLTVLHKDAYSTSVSQLLAMAYLKAGDTIQSEEVLIEGLEIYQYEDSLVMYLVNQLVSSDRMEPAIEILDSAIEARPENFRFYLARGLLYRRMDHYDEAIRSFMEAAERSQENPELYYHLGVSYYNIGIDLRESALHIAENDEYMEIREQYLDIFREAVKWLERSYELDPSNEKTASRLYQLYYQLQMKEEQESLQPVD
ncbi:MAG: tetratricopeptide repeat protein [Bacteroidales bacterium]|nr:tetratricopeptide repeat protein [Bacteroidales bacterium]